MPSKVIQFPGGGGQIVHYAMPKKMKCYYCERPGTQLCDFVLPSGRTHDRSLCTVHAIRVGPNKDFCPEHQERKDP